MRIAVCLSGAQRFASNALTYFARLLPEDAIVDCFCYMWEGGPLDDDESLAAMIAHKTEGRFATVRALIGRGFSMNAALTVHVYPETNVESVFRMYRAIRRCNDMKTDTELRGNFVYDCVVRCRSDVQLSTEIEFTRYAACLHDFIVLPENGHWRGGLNDQFAFSSSANMDAYATLSDYILEHCKAGCVLHPETLLQYHLLKMKIPVLRGPLTASILRD